MNTQLQRDVDYYWQNQIMPYELLQTALTPFLEFIARDRWSLQAAEQLDAGFILDTLRQATGKLPRKLLPVFVGAPASWLGATGWGDRTTTVLFRSLRRLWWLDVEEHLEGDLEASFRKEVSFRSVRETMNIKLLFPLENLLRKTLGNSLFHLGDADTTLWETVQYPLLDLACFFKEGAGLYIYRHALFYEMMRDRKVRILTLLCQVLTSCIPLGEKSDEPGTWLVLCA